MYSQKTKWAMRSVISTILVIVLFVGLGCCFLISGKETLGICLFAALGAMCIGALCFCPMRVRTGNGILEVIFSFRNKTIPLGRIRKAVPYQVTMNFVRFFGSGGFFGWWGWFRNQELGRFMVYASELDHVFLVELEDGKKYIISCSDPTAMCDAINSKR